MTANELRAMRDHVWEQLGRRSPLRRAMLGRQRCDALVRVAADQLPALERKLAACKGDTDMQAAVQRRLERRVRDLYSENCGLAFMTLVIVWAISAIAQALVIRWLNQQQGAAQ